MVSRASLWQHFLAVLDCVAVESDSRLGVEDGAVPEHRFEPAHAAEGGVDFDFANFGVGILADFFDEFALFGDFVREGGFEVGFGGG